MFCVVCFYLFVLLCVVVCCCVFSVLLVVDVVVVVVSCGCLLSFVVGCGSCWWCGCWFGGCLQDFGAPPPDPPPLDRPKFRYIFPSPASILALFVSHCVSSR